MPTYAAWVNGASAKVGNPLSPVSLVVRYGQAREFTFQMPADQVVPLGATVEFKIDGVTRFLGNVVDWQPQSWRQDFDSYIAIDRTDLARDVQINAWRPGVAAALLATIYDYGSNVSLATVLSLVADVYGEELQTLGAAPAGSGDIFTGLTEGVIPRLSVSGESFPDALTALLSSLPGYQWLWRPDTLAWHIVNVWKAPAYTLTMGSDAVAELALSHSIRGRYSKLTMIGQPIPTPSFIEIANGWDAGLEAAWTLKDVTAKSDGGAAYDDAMEHVFRRFDFGTALALANLGIDRNQPVDLRQRIKTKRSPETYEWVSVKVADVDFDDGYITTEQPAIQGVRYDRAGWPPAFQPGKAKPPYAMGLRFFAIDPANTVWLSSEHGGTAHDRYGLTRELVVREAENANVTLERAQLMHLATRDVLISGTVPIIGDVPAWLWNLGVRVNVQAPGHYTGAETMGAVVSGFTHEFGSGGKTTIEVGTDRSPFVGSAML